MKATLTRCLLVCCVAAFAVPSALADAYIFNLRDWEGDHGMHYDCGDTIWNQCSTAKWKVWSVYDSLDVADYRLAYPGPGITLSTWRISMWDCLDADFITHGRSDGAVAAELHRTEAGADSAWSAYLDGGIYGSEDIVSWVMPPGYPEAYPILFLPEGIGNHLSTIDSDALVMANYCHSCVSSNEWGLVGYGGAFLCYPQGMPSTGDAACADLDHAMRALGCEWSPRYGASADDAYCAAGEYGSGEMELLGSAWARYSDYEDCHNIAAAFDGVLAFDGKIVFRTMNETGSFCFFVMGLDSWRDAGTRDWKSWEVLARVRPEGGHGSAHLYEVEGVPDKAVYRIVEVDRYGRPTFSPVFVQGQRPSEYDLWLEHPAIVTAVPERPIGSSDLYQWVSGRSVPYDRGLSLERGARDAGEADGAARVGSRADSSGCADIVVYTNADWDSLLPPVEAHLSDYPTKKVLYFMGSSDLDDARACYGDVYWANVAYNQASGRERFPTDAPGPLLLIVGDSGMAAERFVVYHDVFEDSYGRCYFGACYSDRDATDVTGDGWIGLVHRIPGATVAEVTAACGGADDWNAGEYVDTGHQVIRIVGDELGGTVVDWPVEMAERAASEFLGNGYLPKPVLVQSEFGEGESKVAAFNAQLETGATVLWGFGRVTGELGYNTWPGYFVAQPDSTVHTVKQRMIALLPGCSTMQTWVGYSPLSAARIERWMFYEPDLTQVVGGVGHLVGGWEHQHVKAEELYMAAWMEAPENVPLDWIVWRAAQMAEEQGLDWMSEYFRSAATMGAYVLCWPGDESYTSVPEGPADDPTVWSLHQNAPNPFNPSTTLEYSVPDAGGHVRIDIYDAAGRHVRSLVDEEKRQGVYHVTWDGSTDDGASVSSGVYFCRMDAPGFTERKKLVTLK